MEEKLLAVIFFAKSLISGQMFKMILQSFKGCFTKWCQRNPLWAKIYVTLMGMAKENYFLSIVEIENKKCGGWSKLKTPVELVTNKLIITLDGLHTSN